MIKSKLNINEVPKMIQTCYESDPILIQKYHVLNNQPIKNCINRTVSDFKNYNVEIYVLEHNNEFIGYFGEELVNSDKWLTGFFIMPHKRHHFKKDFWNIIIDHFNGDFKSAVFLKNFPAQRFLMNHGCQFICNIDSVDGIGSVFMYKENI